MKNFLFSLQNLVVNQAFLLTMPQWFQNGTVLNFTKNLLNLFFLFNNINNKIKQIFFTTLRLPGSACNKDELFVENSLDSNALGINL